MSKAQYIISTLNSSVAVPAKWAICPCCEGSGKCDNSAFSNGFTSSEWDDMGCDWDDQDESNGQTRYLNGSYDVPCRECESTGKVSAPDMGALTYPQKRLLAIERSFQRQNARFHAESEAEYAAERRMGA